MFDYFFWTGLFLGLPAVVLLITLVRLIGLAHCQWYAGHWKALVGAGVIAIIVMLLFIRFANEKLLIVIALLCWIYLMIWILRQILGIRHPVEREQAPDSLNHSIVDRGFQGFGIYMNGVRVGNDPIDDDVP